MAIDWSAVNWAYVALLSAIVLVSALIGNYATFRHRAAGAIVTTILFAAAFVFATYYPHGLPLPTLK